MSYLVYPTFISTKIPFIQHRIPSDCLHHLWAMYIASHKPGVTDIFSRIKTISNKPILTCYIVYIFTYTYIIIHICCFMCTVCITHLIAVITLGVVLVLIGCEITHSQCPQNSQTINVGGHVDALCSPHRNQQNDLFGQYTLESFSPRIVPF